LFEFIRIYLFVHKDDGGGMDPISLRKCMTAACPNRKTPDSIGQSMYSCLYQSSTSHPCHV